MTHGKHRLGIQRREQDDQSAKGLAVILAHGFSENQRAIRSLGS
jgi:hypothetical protein